MSSNLTVFRYVSVQANRVVPKRVHLSLEQMHAQEAQDAMRGEEAYASLAPKLKAMVRHLAAFSGYDFRIHFKKPVVGQFSGAEFLEDEGLIQFSYSLLTRPMVEIVQSMAHEWGHLALGHISNLHWPKAVSVTEDEAEQEADFYSGVFLGEVGFNLDEIVHLKLSTAAHDTPQYNKPLFKRVYFLASGHHHGVDRRHSGISGIMGAQAFGRDQLAHALPEDVDSKFLN